MSALKDFRLPTPRNNKAIFIYLGKFLKNQSQGLAFLSPRGKEPPPLCGGGKSEGKCPLLFCQRIYLLISQ